MRGEGVQQSGAERGAILRDYLRVLRRRKWIALLPVVLVPLAAVLFSLQQTKLYSADAKVLISQQNLAAQLSGITDPTQYQQADRVAQTQANLARVPTVAARTLRALEITDRTAGDLLAESSVSPETNANLLEFTVTDEVPVLATRLVNEYARQFARYRSELDTSELERALSEASSRINALEKAGDTRSALYVSLVEKQQQLSTLKTLQTSNAVPVQLASGASQVQPKPKRNAILGLLLGLILGIGLAFLWEALDTRVHSADEIGERLDLPLLARIPEPPKSVRRSDSLVMLEHPRGPHAEAFRMLRTNLEFVRLDRHVKTIVVTSAVPQEGKSTTAANLAVALARGGQNVALVDLDLRRPYVDRFFEAGGPGVTQVALEQAALGTSLQTVPIVEIVRTGEASSNGKGPTRDNLGTIGSLKVLPAGGIPPNAGEFVGSPVVGEIIASLSEVFDTVVVDTPPALHVGDAMTLSTYADAILVVARPELLRRGTLDDLHRLLASTPTPVLGYVVTGGSGDAAYGYGYGDDHSYSYGARESRERERKREKGKV